MQQTSARAVLTADGKLEVASATADIGTGTYTVMTQIAAEALGLPIEDVTFKLGDSSLPKAPVEGGSFTAASVGSAVKAACDKVRENAVRARPQGRGLAARQVEHRRRRLRGRPDPPGGDPSRSSRSPRRCAAGGERDIEAEATAGPDPETKKKYAGYTHSAIFAEVRVDEDLGTVRVTRVVNAVAAGRILNPKTARSQVLGGVVLGIGMALEEESVLDHRLGRFMNHNLAEYHVPVNADVHDIEVIFVEEQDDMVNPLGVKGLGEIGIVGTAAAIANAVFHATGRRIRELPITLDKLMGAGETKATGPGGGVVTSVVDCGLSRRRVPSRRSRLRIPRNPA